MPHINERHDPSAYQAGWDAYGVILVLILAVSLLLLFNMASEPPAPAIQPPAMSQSSADKL